MLFTVGPMPAMATDYYIRPTIGNDLNPGTGKTNSTSWKTLAPVNSKNFFAGDKIFLEGNYIYSGSIYFDQSDLGVSNNPIVITSFGNGKATINSSVSYGFYAYNMAGVSIKNINFVGSGTSTNLNNGILFYSDLPSTLLEGIFLDSIEVRGYLKYGISIGVSNTSSKGFKNVRVTHCKSHDNGEAGISSFGPYRVAGDLPHSDFYLAYNTVYNNFGRSDVTTTHTGSGIMIAAVDNGIIEHCIAYNNGSLNGQICGGPIGIWCYDSNNITIQFCESYNNKAGKSCDGGGFNLDGGVTNSIIQYNYSHNNEGAGYLMAQYQGALPFKGNTIRYNISENDGRKNSYAGIYLWSSGSNGGLQSSQIYNNTIYITPASSGTAVAILIDGPISNIAFRNNIIQTTGGVTLVKSTVTSGITFQGNCYWSSGSAFKIQWGGTSYTTLSDFRTLGNQEKNGSTQTGVMVDPQLTSPGNGGTIGNTGELNTLNEYKLKSTSSLINSGLNLKNLFNIEPGTKDFYGTAIPQNMTYDIGANEFMGTIAECSTTGNILREVWTNIFGNEVKNIPVNNSPASSSYLSVFEGPSSTGNYNYGSRIRGYICPPLTGNYTFWIASNDHSELWLSTNDLATNKVKIANVYGYTRVRQWDKFSSQKSKLIYLKAGSRYYIEALHKQGGGTDNLAVGWQIPNGTFERPISGNRLSSFIMQDNNSPIVSITSPSQNSSFTSPATITIAANASDSDGDVIKVEFYSGSIKLGEDLSAPFSFVWNNVPVGNYSITAKAIDDRAAVSISPTVNVIVTNSGSCSASGTIVREYWAGVSGNSVADIPVHIAPTSTMTLSILEGPSNVGTNYGARIRGYVCAPLSGNYIFYISSNDHSELWLSTDDSPLNKVKIANVVGSTGIRQWDKYSSQKSLSIGLAAGNKYYIEVLHKQGAGTDNIAVGWQLPNGSLERPLPGQVLSPYQLPTLHNFEAIPLRSELGVQEIEMDIKLFPNPFQKGKVALTIEGYENTKHKVEVQIQRISGEIVFVDKFFCETTCRRTIINIDERFSSGTYIVNVFMANKKYSEKLIVE